LEECATHSTLSYMKQRHAQIRRKMYNTLAGEGTIETTVN